MLYYIQKLSGAGSSSLSGPNALDDTVPLETSNVPTPDIFNMPRDDTAQPMLSKIVQAVHKCMASIDDLKEHFGGA